MRQILAVALMAGAVVLAGCGVSGSADSAGSSDASATTTEADSTDAANESTTTGADDVPPASRLQYVAALTTSFAEDTSDHTEARCVAERVIDAIGVEELHAAGVEPDDLEGDGDFVAELGLTAAEQDTVSDAFADAFLDCGATEAMLRATFEEEAPGAISDADIRCGAEALTPHLADSFIDALSDPNINMGAVGSAATPEVLGACPGLAVSIMTAVAAEDGYEVTPEETACLLEAFTRLGAEDEGLTQDVMLEALRTCLTG